MDNLSHLYGIKKVFVLLMNLTCARMDRLTKYLSFNKFRILNVKRSVHMRLIIILVLIILSKLVFATEEVKGRVVKVQDGNTIQVISENKDSYQVVLAGIDCPELKQQFGVEAKKYLEKLVLNKTVKVIINGKDRRGNYVGVVLINGDDDLRIELLKEGLAWTSEKKLHPELEPYRSWAEQKKRGLWKEGNPTPPWTYRRQQTMETAKSS